MEILVSEAGRPLSCGACLIPGYFARWPADSISGNDEVGEPVSGDVSNMEPASNPGCFYSFVAFDAGPMPGRVAVWLFGTVTDDVERTVAALELGVAVPHVFVGSTVGECHRNCHDRDL